MCLCSNCHEVKTRMTHKPGFHMVLSPNERQTVADRSSFTPHLHSQLSSDTVLFAPRVRITQKVFNQFPVKSVSWLTGRKVTDFAQDQRRDATHTAVIQLLNRAENSEYTAGTVRNDRPTASYPSSTFVQLWWSVSKPHP